MFPRQIAKLITNASFVKWLATPPVKGGKGKIAAHIGRLSAIAKANPLIREDIHRFLESLFRSDEPKVSLQGAN